MAMGTKIADMTVGLHFDGSKMYVDMKQISKKAESEASNAGGKAGKGFSAKMGVAMGAVAGIASSVFSKVGSTISSSMDSAIGRMDTLNNFPRVMQSLGYAADESANSINTISDRLDGLPTTLDSMVSNTQMLAASLGNLNQGTVNATSVGLAFNDMMLASGKGTEAADRAFTQYNQMLAKGKVDQQSWNTLIETAPGQMNQLAESLLGAGKNQKDLYEALQNGTISLGQMNEAMVRLDTEGGEGFESFNQQAIASTDGLATRLENVRTSITKVITAALQGQDMSKPLEQLVSRVSTLADQLVPAIGNIIIGIVEALPPMLESITMAVVEYLPTFIEQLMAQLPILVQGLIDMMVNLVNQLVPMLPQILMSLVNGLINFLLTITAPENMQKMLQATISLFMAMLQALPQIIVALINALPQIISNIVAFFTDPANIGMIISAAVQLFMGLVQAVPQILGALFGAFGKLFGDLWNRLTGLFSEFAGNFGKTIGDVFKNAINGVIGFIEGFLNTPINAINGLIDIINTIPFIDLGKLPTFELPRLAEGGIAMSASTAVIGEAGREAVLPLEQNTGNWSGLLAHALAEEMGNQGTTVNEPIQVTINNNINNDLDAREIGQVMMESIRRAAA